jgi:hypothetical protein
MTDDTTAEMASKSGTFLENTRVQDARVEGYDLPYEKTDDRRESRVKRHSLQLNHREVEGNTEVESNPALKYAIKQYLGRAIKDTKRMEQFAVAGDVMELAMAGMSLRDNLRELWRLRSARDDEWAAVVNFIQAALCQVEFERFTSDQCCAIRKILESHLSLNVVGDDDVKLARRTLQHAGFDPWKGLTAEISE